MCVFGCHTTLDVTCVFGCHTTLDVTCVFGCHTTLDVTCVFGCHTTLDVTCVFGCHTTLDVTCVFADEEAVYNVTSFLLSLCTPAHGHVKVKVTNKNVSDGGTISLVPSASDQKLEPGKAWERG